MKCRWLAALIQAYSLQVMEGGTRKTRGTTHTIRRGRLFNYEIYCNWARVSQHSWFTDPLTLIMPFLRSRGTHLCSKKSNYYSGQGIFAAHGNKNNISRPHGPPNRWVRCGCACFQYPICNSRSGLLFIYITSTEAGIPLILRWL